jgi:cob(I)alamin adenosyltransferase
MAIYTRAGDKGMTALFGGSKVSKSELRVAAYGEVDELNSAIGAAVACAPEDLGRELLDSIQRDLFSIGALLAAPEPGRVAGALARAKLPSARVTELETAIDRADVELAPLDAFVLPGGTMKSALLHQARTVCRRAEREVVALAESATIPIEIIPYLNRLSDFLFTLARLANHRASIPDKTW